MNNELDFDCLFSTQHGLLAEHYDQLTALLCKYPYFQYLILRKLQFVKEHLPEQYPNLLRRYTVTIHDHKHLFLFLTDQIQTTEVSVINGIYTRCKSAKEFPDQNVTETKNEIVENNVLSEKTTEVINDSNLLEDKFMFELPTHSVDWHLNETEMNNSQDRCIEMNDDLIDRFMREQPSMPKLDPTKTEMRSFVNKEVDSENELFSETLAKIYLKQRLYDKAIATYIKLSLKFPEKSVYFANRIEIIKEKINN